MERLRFLYQEAFGDIVAVAWDSVLQTDSSRVVSRDLRNARSLKLLQKRNLLAGGKEDP
jgi:hypothetical protein